jgi:hypothetical protein
MRPASIAASVLDPASGAAHALDSEQSRLGMELRPPAVERASSCSSSPPAGGGATAAGASPPVVKWPALGAASLAAGATIGQAPVARIEPAGSSLPPASSSSASLLLLQDQGRQAHGLPQAVGSCPLSLSLLVRLPAVVTTTASVAAPCFLHYYCECCRYLLLSLLMVQTVQRRAACCALLAWKLGYGGVTHSHQKH